jgi:hypothetical protein
MVTYTRPTGSPRCPKVSKGVQYSQNCLCIQQTRKSAWYLGHLKLPWNCAIGILRNIGSPVNYRPTPRPCLLDVLFPGRSVIDKPTKALTGKPKTPICMLPTGEPMLSQRPFQYIMQVCSSSRVVCMMHLRITFDIQLALAWCCDHGQSVVWSWSMDPPHHQLGRLLEKLEVREMGSANEEVYIRVSNSLFIHSMASQSKIHSYPSKISFTKYLLMVQLFNQLPKPFHLV